MIETWDVSRRGGGGGLEGWDVGETDYNVDFLVGRSWQCIGSDMIDKIVDEFFK